MNASSRLPSGTSLVALDSDSTVTSQPNSYVLLQKNHLLDLQTIKQRLTNIFKGCTFTQRDNSWTSVIKSPKSKRTQKIIFGKETLHLWKNEHTKLKNSGLLSFPQYLHSALQALPLKYQFMSLKDIIIFSFLKTTRKFTDDSVEQDNYLAYSNESGIIMDIILNKIRIQNYVDIQTLIRSLHKAGDTDFILVLSAFGKYLQELLHQNPTRSILQLPQPHEKAWNTPIKFFHFSNLITPSEEVKEQIEEDVYLNLCSLLPILNDYHLIFSHLDIDRHLEALENSFQKLMDTLHLIVELQYINSVFYSMPVDGATSSLTGPTLLVEDRALLTHDFLSFHLHKIRLCTAKARAIYAMEIGELLEAFSPTHAERIFREQDKEHAREIIETRISELEESAEGVVQLDDKLYDTLNVCGNFVHAFLLYPTWFCTSGMKCSVANYQDHFFKYVSTLKLSCGLHDINELIFKELAVLSSTLGLKEPIENLKTDVQRLIFAFEGFLRHTAALRWHFDNFKSTISRLKTPFDQEPVQIAPVKLTQEQAEYHHSQLLEEVKPKKPSRKNTQGRTQSIRPHTTASQSEPPLSSTPSSLTSSPQENDPVTTSIEPFTTPSSLPQLSPMESTSAPISSSLIEICARLSDCFKRLHFNNQYANQSWKSAATQLDDLIAEMQDTHSLNSPSVVSERVNRWLIISTLLIQKVLSSYVLEHNDPKDDYEKWDLLRHETTYLMTASNLAGKYPTLPSIVSKMGELECLSRSLYTRPKQTGDGAELLYQAETLRLSESGDPQAVLKKGYSLLTELLQFVNELVNPGSSLSFKDVEPLISHSPIFSTGSEATLEVQQLLNQALSYLPSDQLEFGNISSPIHHLVDARRQLELFSIRLQQGLEGGNLRNYFKSLTPALPNAIESLAIAAATDRRLISWDKIRRSDLTHNLMEWCERLHFTEHTPPQREYLYASGNLQKYIRNPELFNRGGRSTRLLEQLALINRYVITHLDSEWITRITDRQARKQLQQIVNELHTNSKVGLEIFIELAKRVIPQRQTLHSSSSTS
ncbi:MAG: hypothetical protein ACHQUC_05815 [Chlamydiales bacterium]